MHSSQKLLINLSVGVRKNIALDGAWPSLWQPRKPGGAAVKSTLTRRWLT